MAESSKTDVRISKALSWLLRHGAEKEGLILGTGGWAKLEDVLRKPTFKKVDDLDLEEITIASDAESVVHGTYYRHWNSIKEQGLCRMNRTHIHFAPGLPGEAGVISGMRSSCQIFIYVDLAKALRDGFKFFKSANNVIMCSGNEAGYLPPEYFLKVVDKRTNKELV
ncbi:tRNA 2'-phosphotransferase 1 isoform X3 [Cherax quadricarinatus]|uniref:tRNA 2'-phosphotransferase 1 isoform X3 n=1 Tax=Cherax quadricarinatus TaxID=27406 RepID=UPI0023780894|nr:tRNA 2'-phosphotransferase 1-like isoform X3 [Cherax quadricarinatus]